MVDASQRVLDMGDVRPQTVTDRVADPDRVGHEEHRPEQVPAQERAEWKANCSSQWSGQKAEPADESRDADRDPTIPTDETDNNRGPVSFRLE
jgi:hypothetical protein